MELADIEIRRDGGAFIAEQVGGYCLGDRGYTVTATGWGETEEIARASLAEAIVDMRTFAEAEGK